MLMLLVAAGCGEPPTPQAACASYAKAWCAREAACFGTLSVQLSFGDVATCEARLALSCMVELAALRTGASPSSYDACAATLTDAACDALSAGGCAPAAGELPDGASCAFDSQCQSASCTLGSRGCGTCQPPTVAGDSCSIGCGNTLTCDPATLSCLPLSGAASCDLTHGCGPSAACVGAEKTKGGQCQPRGGLGATCDAGNITAAACDNRRGLYCDSATKTCVEYKLASVGQPCGVVGKDVFACAGAACITSGSTQTCVARAAEGRPCDVDGAECAWPAVCRVKDDGSAACALPNGAVCDPGGSPILTNPTPPPSTPFVPAAHDTSLQIVDRGGPVLAAPALVTITYSRTRYRADVDAWGAWSVRSSWLTQVGAEYGVGHGTHQAVHLSEPDPATLTQTDLEAFLQAKIANQTLPAPTANTLYMVFLRDANTAFTRQGETACYDFDGYHSTITVGTEHYPYAVVIGCAPVGNVTELAQTQETASHELIEAATDPLISTAPGFLPPPPLSGFGEVADLCEGHLGFEEGFLYQRSWSNAAQDAGGDPCVPADPTQPFFSVSIAPEQVHFASPGEVIDYTLTGWSSGPVGTWSVSVLRHRGDLTPLVRDPFSGKDLPLADGDAVAVPDAPVFNNGTKGHLTITIPADAKSGQGVLLQVRSSLGRHRYTRWPLIIAVP